MTPAGMRQAVEQHGGIRPAARAMGIAESTLRSRIKASQGAQNEAAERGQALTGLSTLVDMRTGENVLQWVKTKVDDQARAIAQQEAAKALAASLPRYAPVPITRPGDDDLLSVYVLTDYHFGMLAWSNETGGDDWDLQIAERLMIDWFSTAIRLSPRSGRAILANLGDLLHWDGMDAVTPQHKHLLDADTRFAKLVRTVIRCLRRIIRMLLEHHDSLKIIMADANHDPASEAWMREWLAAVYEDEPRIEVETSANAYYCDEHGLTMNCFHHGHKRGVKDVDRVFAGLFSEAFGRTKHRYAHLGHLHSDEVNETPLMRVERHRTLAAPDAYAAKGGWLSGRDAKVITYSKRYGEVSRLVINPDMVRAGGA